MWLSKVPGLWIPGAAYKVQVSVLQMALAVSRTMAPVVFLQDGVGDVQADIANAAKYNSFH